MEIKLKSITKSFSGKEVIRDMSLNFPDKKISCIMGASGCGKTTLLRIIAGFESFDSGELFIGDKKVADEHKSLPPQERGIGFVFQDYALFPHMNALENVCFGLHELDREEALKRANKYLDIVGLSSHSHKLPHQMSGGQKQRLALARALAPEPHTLLMDEAFSNIDSHLRESLAREIVSIIRSLDISCIFVTHSQQEAFSMADYVAVIHDHNVEQFDTAYNIYHRPQTPFVAKFIGEGRFIKAKLTENLCLQFSGIEICNQKQTQYKAGDELLLLLRPDDIIHEDSSSLKAEVVHKSFRGAHLVYELKLQSGEQVISFIPSHHNHKIGEAIGIRFELDHVVCFPK